MPSSAASQQLASFAKLSSFAAVSRRLGCSEASVRSWVAGKAAPRSAIRISAASEFSIPLDAWDAPPTVADLAQPAERPAPPAGDLPSARSVLDAELARLDRLEAGSKDWNPRDRVGLSTARAGIAARLAKFSGEEATDERKLLESPSFRLVMRTVGETLSAYPVAAAAVSAALRALDEKSTS